MIFLIYAYYFLRMSNCSSKDMGNERWIKSSVFFIISTYDIYANAEGNCIYISVAVNTIFHFRH